MTRRARPLAAGVCVLRDAGDMVPFLCGHYLGMGLDRILIIDDGSRDGSGELLAELARRSPAVAVQRVDNERFEQAALMTAGANRLIDEGCRLIVPFDADEFWNLSPAAVDTMAARHQPRRFRGRWVNFVQDRRALRPRLRNVLTVRQAVASDEEVHLHEVRDLVMPFVAHTCDKVAFWADGPVELDPGQHRLLHGPERLDEAALEIFHLPLRNRAELVKRALDYEPRRAPLRKPGSSVQSRMHRECVLGGHTDLLWEANSADRNGTLGRFASSVALEPDTRLRRTFVQAGTTFVRLFGPRLLAQALAPRRRRVAPADRRVRPAV